MMSWKHNSSRKWKAGGFLPWRICSEYDILKKSLEVVYEIVCCLLISVWCVRLWWHQRRRNLPCNIILGFLLENNNNAYFCCCFQFVVKDGDNKTFDVVIIRYQGKLYCVGGMTHKSSKYLLIINSILSLNKN